MKKSILEFKELLEMELLIKHIDFTVKPVEKTNQQKTGIILTTGENLCPCFYIEDLYEDYVNGKDITTIISDMLNVEKVNFDTIIENFHNFNSIKNYILPIVINTELNKNLLESVPNKKFISDLSYVYKLVFPKQDGQGTITIKHTHLEEWGITIDDINTVALSNLNDSSYKIQNMGNIIKEIMKEQMEIEDLEMLELMGDDDFEFETEMYVISDNNLLNGPMYLLNNNLLKELKEIFEKDFVILPSSIHEFIAVSPDVINSQTLEELVNMVKEVNETQVDIKDFLSDNPIIYSLETDMLMSFDEYKEILLI